MKKYLLLAGLLSLALPGPGANVYVGSGQGP